MAAGSRLVAADKQHAPCFDYYIEKNEATLAKRFNKSPKVSIATSPAHETASSYSILLVDRHVVEQPPRVSQALLAHRTVVLRN